jgi:hypothetical protein
MGIKNAYFKFVDVGLRKCVYIYEQKNVEKMCKNENKLYLHRFLPLNFLGTFYDVFIKKFEISVILYFFIPISLF